MIHALDRRVAASAKAGPNEPFGWGASACLYLFGLALVLGWSIEEDFPLRPWPQWKVGRYRGAPRLMIGILGLYVLVAWVRWHPLTPTPRPSPGRSET